MKKPYLYSQQIKTTPVFLRQADYLKFSLLQETLNKKCIIYTGLDTGLHSLYTGSSN